MSRAERGLGVTVIQDDAVNVRHVVQYPQKGVWLTGTVYTNAFGPSLVGDECFGKFFVISVHNLVKKAHGIFVKGYSHSLVKGRR